MKDDIRYKIGDLVLNNYKHPLGVFKIIVGLYRLKKRILLNSKKDTVVDPQKVRLIVKDLECESLIYANINLNVIDGSSVWLTSIANAVSSYKGVVLISQRNVDVDYLTRNIKNNNVTIVQPKDVGLEVISPSQAFEIAKILDRYIPKLRNVFLRGLNVVSEFHSDRTFYKRTNVYLTDFYKVNEGVTESTQKILYNISLQVKSILYQTDDIKIILKDFVSNQVDFIHVPPSLPSSAQVFENKEPQRKVPVIVYAGKVNENWGVIELIDWVESIDYDVSVKIIANKFSGKVNGCDIRKYIEKKAKKNTISIVNGLTRDEVIKELNDADYVWCYRPSRLEDGTLELSTKLLEAIVYNGKALCYPSNINKGLLGDDYPYYLRNPDQLSDALSSNPTASYEQLRHNVLSNHSLDKVKLNLEKLFRVNRQEYNQDKILFAGHDLKFLDAYISDLKLRGHAVQIDDWNWGSQNDETISKELMSWSDVVFCEWGLSNAVWFSNNLLEGKKLVIRIHLQEINERARKFGYKIDINNVSKVIFVSDRVRKEAINLWGWPVEKTVVISNYVLTGEFSVSAPQQLLKNKNAPITIGMVGIVPKRKRFDRAISLLDNLRKNGINAELHIKGHRPENLPFMTKGSRAMELDFYNEQYQRIEDLGLKEKVLFSGWGNDVASWYKNVDFILSPSEFESFHYAMADGIASGCFPVIWDWDESKGIYIEDWIVSDTEGATQRILNSISTGRINDKEACAIRQSIIEERYGSSSVFQKLDEAIWCG